MVFWCGGGELVDLVLYCTFVIPIWQMMDTVMHSVLTDIKGGDVPKQQQQQQCTMTPCHFFLPSIVDGTLILLYGKMY